MSIDPTPALPPATLACPACGSTGLSFDWTGITTVRIENGVLRHVHVGGVFGVLPDTLVCDNCGEEVPCPPALGEAAAILVETTVPARVRDAHTDGFLTYATDPQAGPLQATLARPIG